MVSQEDSRTRPNKLDVILSGSQPLLACYLPIADPLVGESIVQVYRDSGVNIVELGLPTRDPRVDGSDVAASMHRAIDTGCDIAQSFRFASDQLRTDAPSMATVCMTYADADLLAASPVSTFSSIDAMLVLGERASSEVREKVQYLKSTGVRSVVFVPDQFTDADVESARACDGYVMLQAASGVTGPREVLDPGNAQKIRRLRSAGVGQRILLGFGISTPDQARAAMHLGADGVVIGSMCLRKAIEGPTPLRSFLQAVRVSIDG